MDTNNFGNMSYNEYKQAESRARVRMERIAKRRVRAKLVFRLHIAAWFLGSAVMLGIYFTMLIAYRSPTQPWFLWPMIIWAMFIILHLLMLAKTYDETYARAKRRWMVQQEVQRLRDEDELQRLTAEEVERMGRR